ncbi:MAG TPA: DUF3006 domain-containing protein [Candidatus Uhrbacteria bacterium]|nr:DUF3006 domain-containing protein [Candidatus Uhrbacteria bacterium]
MTKSKAIIDRFEEQKAVLVFADSQQLIVERDVLPPGSKEGDVVYLDFVYDHQATDQKEDEAKNILEKILRKKDV